MKKQTVAEIQADENIQSHFLIREKEIRSNATSGKSWLVLTLADSTGAISGKMWDGFEGIYPALSQGMVVRVKARAKEYRGNRELTVQQIEPANPGEYDLADFLPHTKKGIEEMFARLRGIVGGMGNPFLKKLNMAVLDDPELSGQLKRSPAASVMHHAYIGGLLEHVLSLCELAKLVAGHYPEVDVDLLLTVAVLHDIGKTVEISSEPGFAYTTEGHLLGHPFISMKIARAKMEGIENFPAGLAIVVEHLIASHHGTAEFGAIREPRIREAVLFHMLDDMDAKMAAIRAAHESSGSAGEEWTDRVFAIGQKLLRTEEFLNPGAKAEAATARPAGAPTLFPLGPGAAKAPRGRA